MEYKKIEDKMLDKLKTELSPKLTYHGPHHTLDVLSAAIDIASKTNIAPNDLNLLKTAVIFHDSGFLIQYKDHEEAGCKIAGEFLPEYNYTPDEIRKIQGMIMATKIPQNPKNLLEKIICDADLDYLGRDDFEQIASTLFEELKAFDMVETEEQWNKIQVNFLSSHSYYTPFSQKEREPAKMKHLLKIKNLVSTYM